MARCTLNQKYLDISKSFTKFRGAWLQMQNLMKIMTIPPKKNEISQGHMSQLALLFPTKTSGFKAPNPHCNY